jgi:hypothetical protein
MTFKTILPSTALFPKLAVIFNHGPIGELYCVSTTWAAFNLLAHQRNAWCFPVVSNIYLEPHLDFLPFPLSILYN